MTATNKWPRNDRSAELCRDFATRRRQLGISQIEAEARLGTAPGYLAWMEIGLRAPSLALACDWAKLLGLKLMAVADPLPSFASRRTAQPLPATGQNIPSSRDMPT